VLREAIEMVSFAREHGLIVELSGEDASRADLGYLKTLYQAGVDAGAERLCFCDTVGVLVPEKTDEIFTELSKLKAPMSIHCHNDFGLAAANTIAAIRAGAREAHVTVNGLGERAGNAPLEEVVIVLETLYNAESLPKEFGKRGPAVISDIKSGASSCATYRECRRNHVPTSALRRR